MSDREFTPDGVKSKLGDRLKKGWRLGSQATPASGFLGGDPSAGSPTDTLLRLNPPCRRQARIRHKAQPHPPPTKMV